MNSTGQPRWEVISAEALAMDNGPMEKWYITCRHSNLIGFARKSDATDYRAWLWDRRRAHDIEAVAEICEACGDEAA